MALVSGTKLGPYEIQSPLGAGGMGEVYRARDTRLDRIVAIKVLPANLSSDPSLRQRLEREAKAISKLSHPHICTLHDIGHQDGMDFLVMEFVEGETLEQRLTKGPLSFGRTVRFAAQIADALATAHKQGITHRDLKPSNVMLTKAGAKLMDFGLAKQAEMTPLGSPLTEVTMAESKLTGVGAIVGTFQYMAPEQLEGKDVDARTDMFALGELIYEMATGKPAFSGKSRASLIAAILTTEPQPITQLQPLTPPALERVVKRCLAKDPDDRWQSASDLASELKWMTEGGSSAASVPGHAPARRSKPQILVWRLAAISLLAAAVVLIHSQHPPAAGEAMHFNIALPTNARDLALSPDGRMLAVVASSAEGHRNVLWLHQIGSTQARALEGTEGASYPFWSPDSLSIGFFADSKLKRVDAAGGGGTGDCRCLRRTRWNLEP
jgi:eukaryotic-like serine/threonine-protein kinase